MCGICGIASSERLDPSVRNRIDAMNNAMIHRGPDDVGVWLGNSAALGMRRLSVIDLEGGRQPMTNEDGSVALAFNGEIYNFRELRSELESRGRQFRTQSDTEVVLRAFEEYGEAALTRLNGMFAIAIADSRNNSLLLARDRCGIKPLYYSHAGGQLTFASELSALTASELIADELDYASIDQFFEFLYIPSPHTIYRNVKKLCPGEKLVFTNGQVRTERYWSIDYKPDASWTLDSAAERYLELLTDAVQMQLVSDVPLGAFLSGGVDSSSVVGIMSYAMDAPVKTFTIGFDDAHADELRYARLAAERFQTEHTEEILSPDLVSICEEFPSHFGEPFADSSALPTWLLSRTSRKKVTVALSGDGGDELFAGYTWTHVNHLLNHYRKAPRMLRRLFGIVAAGAPEPIFREKLRRFHNDSLLDSAASFRSRTSCFTAAQREQLYTEAFRDELKLTHRDSHRKALEITANLSDDDAMLFLDTALYLPDDILTKVDRMSMAHSLEVRVPLLDHRLVEFAATVPFHLKYRWGTSKRLVKRAVKDLLPQELLRQRKQGFGIPIHTWLRASLADYFRDVVLSDTACCGEYLDISSVKRIFDAHIRREGQYGHHLWALIMFEQWLRTRQRRKNSTT